MSEIRNAGWQNAQEKEKNSMDKIEKYIDELLEKSTPDRPIWNIEKILQGKKSTWNYIDGCMIVSERISRFTSASAFFCALVSS